MAVLAKDHTQRSDPAHTLDYSMIWLEYTYALSTHL
ncbi:rCG31061 [Rattus norvegicus]|uniref:RCG31061 n=1 Tax=Rattus norvegicus TaxID=10116 RepID=A6ISM0_RAT|nr:rCG31061 [Rattus norvegicus]